MVCMVKVQIGEFRDHVCEYVRRAENGETIVVANRSREVAVLQPRLRTKRSGRRLLGCLKGTARLRGDILAAIPAEDWFRS